MNEGSESDQPWQKLHGWRKLVFSFRVAMNGLRLAWQSQQNFRIHLLVTLLVAFVAGVLRVSLKEAALLVLCVGAVLSAEILNTAIENLVDLVSPRADPRAGAIKDLSAGGVLVICLAAALAGLLILVPRLLTFGWGF